MQLVTASTVVEAVEWVKVLGNIMSVVDHEKVEMATGGAWRAAVCRCLTMLMDGTKTRKVPYIPGSPRPTDGGVFREHRWGLPICRVDGIEVEFAAPRQCGGSRI